MLFQNQPALFKSIGNSHYYCNLGYCSSLLRITYTVPGGGGVRN